MATDLKTSFYFRHRALIEEWAALREPARTSFDTALRSLGGRFALTAQATEATPIEPDDSKWSKVGLTKLAWNRRGWELSVVLGWNNKTLLDPMGRERPYIGVFLGPRCTAKTARSAAIRAACLPVASDLGWLEPAEDAWPISGWIDQPTDDETLDAWTDACATSFERGWSRLHERLDEIVN